MDLKLCSSCSEDKNFSFNIFSNTAFCYFEYFCVVQTP